MVTRWNRISLAFAVLALAAGCDSRKEVVVEHRDVPTEATHDGHLVVLDGGPRVELVHDQSNGMVTLYTLRSDDRVIAFEQAPLLEIHTVEGVVPVTFVRVEGEAHAWRATHDVFRRADVSDVRLIARADGRRFEESIALRDGWAEPASPATPASLPPAEDAAPPADVTPSDDAAPAPAEPVVDDPAVTAPPSRRGDEAPAPVTEPADDVAEPAPTTDAAPTTPPTTPAPTTPAPADEAPAAEEASAPSSSGTASERTIQFSGGASARLTVEAKTGAVTIRLLDADGRPLDAEKVVVVIPAADDAAEPREVSFLRPRDASAGWTATDVALRMPEGARLVVTVDGKPQEAAFLGVVRSDADRPAKSEPVVTPPSEDTPAPAPQDDAQRQEIPAAAPADEPPPRDNAPAPKAGTDSTGDGKTDKPKPDEEPDLSPTDAPGTSNKPADTMANEARMALEGSHLLAVPGTDMRLEVLHDKNVGKLTVQAIQGRGAVALDDAPVLFAVTDEGPQKATLTRLEGKQAWWILHTGLKGRDAVGRIRISIAGKVYDVDLLGDPVPAGDVDTETVLLGDREYVVERDTGSASIFLRGLGVEDMRVMVRGEDGRLFPVGFAPVPGRPNTFLFRHDAFRNQRFEGTITGRMNGRTVEGRLSPRGTAPAPTPGTNTGGAGTTSTGTTTSGTTGSGTTTSGTTTSGTTTSGQTESGTTTSGTTGGGAGSGSAAGGASGSGTGSGTSGGR